MPDYQVSINGEPRTANDVDADTPLLWVLRDVLDMKGTKFGCGIAQCGACTVHLGGTPIRSCSFPISAVTQEVTTVEGLSDGGELSALQKTWVELDVPQCGYCQAGQLMSATALLKSNSNPTDADIDSAMQGNICRCNSYARIREAIHQAADMEKEEGNV